MYTAIAEAVEEWQKLKEQGKLEGEGEEEEDIYAEARMVDVSVEFITVQTVTYNAGVQYSIEIEPF